MDYEIIHVYTDTSVNGFRDGDINCEGDLTAWESQLGKTFQITQINKRKKVKKKKKSKEERIRMKKKGLNN